MLSARLVPCLLLDRSGLVKSVRFKDHRYIGDAINAVRIFNEKEIDELIVLDINATRDQRGPDFEMARQLASECFMPLCFGGGVATIDDMERLFSIGVEKVAIGSAAEGGTIIAAGAARFGSQAIVGVVDVLKGRVVTRGGGRLEATPEEHARNLVEAGAGEILLQSVDRDGTYAGYDLELVRRVVDAVGVPVIALGGAKSLDDMAAVVVGSGASAAAAGSLFVYQGPHKAVLINVPDRHKWAAALRGENAEASRTDYASLAPTEVIASIPILPPDQRQEGVCSMTVMDTTDPEISFDDQGVSNHAHHAAWRLAHEVYTGAEGERRLAELVAEMKAAGDGRPYDCVIGVSGGVDSTYVACRVIDLGLRPLAVHLDAGWNSDLAVSNIEKTMTRLGIDLVTHVIDWEEVKDLQRSYFKASVVDVECVSDHAINTILFKMASKHRVRHIVHGVNVATEAIMPKSWVYDKRDGINLKAIHRRFGDRSLSTFPVMMPWDLLKYIFVDRIKAVSILNYENYNKPAVLDYLQERLDWRPYERKHGESRFTRFFQEYYLVNKFGYDKRKSHLSSQIVSGQITRSEAVEALSMPLYAPGEAAADLEYVSKKLGFTVDEFSRILEQAPRKHTDFGNAAWMFDHRNGFTQLIRYFAKGELRIDNFLSALSAGRAGHEKAH